MTALVSTATRDPSGDELLEAVVGDDERHPSRTSSRYASGSPYAPSSDPA